MIAERNDRNFHAVYVGGPCNGLIEEGRNTLALLRSPEGRTIGLKIRRMIPWYLLDQNRPPIGLEEAMRMHELAGIEPHGNPTYVLEETTDPDIYRYRFIGEYDPVRDDSPAASVPA